jgi:hypothetical protein
MYRRAAEPPGSFKCLQMTDYLSAVAPASTIALSLLGESDYALARFRAFFKAREKTRFA